MSDPEPLSDEQLARLRVVMDCDRHTYGVVTRLLEEHAALRRECAQLKRERDLLRRYITAQFTWEVLLGTREAEGALAEISAATEAIAEYGLSHEAIAHDRDLRAAERGRGGEGG